MLLGVSLPLAANEPDKGTVPAFTEVCLVADTCTHTFTYLKTDGEIAVWDVDKHVVTADFRLAPRCLSDWTA